MDNSLQEAPFNFNEHLAQEEECFWDYETFYLGSEYQASPEQDQYDSKDAQYHTPTL